MKKLLLVLAIASFAACNDAGTGEENAADSSAITVDSSAVAPTPDSAAVSADTTAVADSTIQK